VTADFLSQVQAALGAAYTVERELGGGGMSRVFVATENTLGRKVVVKVLPPDLAAEVSAERFRREIQVAAQLQNAHIVPLLTAGQGEGLLYYTMPFVEGETLRAKLAREGELPLSAAIQVLRDVAKALAYAHRNGVVHRDIKPENILISDGDALVADFGVAKAIRASATHGDAGLTSVGMALGTPAYMAPEQAAGDATADARADLYALGAVAYEMLTGSSLFPGRSPQALLAAHTTETPESIKRRRPNLPPAIATLVMRLLEKRPADRPQAAEEVLRTFDDTAISGGTGLIAAHQNPGTKPPGANRRRLALGLALASIISGAILVAIALRPHRAVPVAGGAEASIAVLPFVNMSGDKENEYFSDGMTEELIDRLANLHGMRVAARTSSFAFRGKDVNVSEIGRQLHVHNVVEGSVRRSGSHVRITAQLIDADSGYHRWSHTYDADVKDAFAVQQQIGAAIAGELQLTLEGRDSVTLAHAPTSDTAAHGLYLRGLYHWNQRTSASLTVATKEFREAIARDTNYVEAYAALAETYSILPSYLDVMPDSVFALGVAAAHRALALDSANAQAHSALGNLLAEQYQWEASIREYERAIALNPRDPTPHHWYALTLATLGRFPDAIREGRLAVEADPLSQVSRQDLAEVYLQSGDFDAAEAEARRVLKMDPLYAGGWATLGAVLVFDHRFDSAIAVLRRGIASQPMEPYSGDLAMLAYAFAVSGQRDSALAIQRQLQALSKRRFVSPGALAMIELGLGRKDAAIPLIARGIDTHDAYTAEFFPNDPAFASLKGDPRLAALKRRMHLPA